MKDTVEATYKIEGPRTVAFRDERTGKLVYYRMNQIDRCAELRLRLAEWREQHRVWVETFDVNQWAVQLYEWEFDDEEVRLFLSRILEEYMRMGFSVG